MRWAIERKAIWSLGCKPLTAKLQCSSESLLPRSTKKKLNRDGVVAIGDEEERVEKESNSIQQLSQATMDAVSDEEEVNFCGIPLIRTCKDAGGASVTFVLERASLTLANVGKVEERVGGMKIEDGVKGSHGVVDPTIKVLIRDTIVSDNKVKNMAQHPDNVLAFSRSVNKIDSSLE
uniref:Uncharacterized protein n=1 Tax=Chenopodium quinoa TaxID=63459 RepID=A0A803LT64_CHEQI